MWAQPTTPPMGMVDLGRMCSTEVATVLGHQQQIAAAHNLQADSGYTMRAIPRPSDIELNSSAPRVVVAPRSAEGRTSSSVRGISWTLV